MGVVSRTALNRAPASLVIRLLVVQELLHGEPEARLVRRLCDGRGFVDVGANRGVYSFVARRCSSFVAAIEPNARLVDFLRSWTKGTMRVEQVALSDSTGWVDLFIPMKSDGEDDGLSSIEPIHAGRDPNSVVVSRVRRERLDDLELDPVGFVKVDVEGHELEVLRGAVSILNRDQPLILVECEERHRADAVSSVSELLGESGYRGFFVLNDSLVPISEFEPASHQRHTDVGNHQRYRNNFFFCATESQEMQLRHAVKHGLRAEDRDRDRPTVLMVRGSVPPMPCGVGAYSAALAGVLQSKVDLHCIDPAASLKPRSRGSERRWRLNDTVRLVRLAHRLEPDWVTLQYPTRGFARSLSIHLIVPALKLLRLRVLVTLHEHAASPPVGRIRNLAIVALADRVFLSNALDIQALPQRLKKKSEMVPIGSNIPVTKESVPARAEGQRSDLGQGRPVVAFFGHPFPSKRLERLIDLASSDAERFHYLFIATFSRTDPYQLRLRSELEQLEESAASRVTVVEGASDSEVSILLQQATYLVMPDDHPLTGKSGSSLAGIVHGLVVLGKRAADPAMNLPFVDLENCVLLDSLEPAAIEAALRRLDDNASLRCQLTEGAQRLSLHFTWDSIVERYLNVMAPGLAADSDPK